MHKSGPLALEARAGGVITFIVDTSMAVSVWVLVRWH